MKKAPFILISATSIAVLTTCTAWASTTTNATLGPKVTFEKHVTTDLNVLRDRAIHGITDKVGLVTANSGFVGPNPKKLHAKSFTTAEKIKEVVNRDGTKVDTYHVTTFNEITPNTTNYGPSQWDSTYSWECIANEDVQTMQGSNGAMYGKLLDGNVEWDTGGQTTGVPSISGAEVRYGEEGLAYGGGSLAGDYRIISVGTPVQYYQYSFDCSSYGWPYAGWSGGDCKTVGIATLTFSDGSTETFWNSNQWGNGVSSPSF